MDRRLPTFFERMKNGRVFVSSISGNWKIFKDQEFDEIVGDLNLINSNIKSGLYSLGLLEPLNTKAIQRLEGVRLRDAHRCYDDSFSYFIIVATLRCNQTCEYCQVSRKPESSTEHYDLNIHDAEAIAKLIKSSPRSRIKVEFQGGESTLNIEFIERLISKLNHSGKSINYVITTNLVSISARILAICKQYSVDISVSLDGPEDLHTKNRRHPKQDYFKDILKNINLARSELGNDRVNAVCTVSRHSLARAFEIPLFYKQLGFNFLSFRHITEIGFARHNNSYTFSEWFEAYKNSLLSVLNINLSGYHMVEGIANLYIQKLFGSRRNIFVDMHNPVVMGANAVVVNYDGEIYLSDESRMLAEEGDRSLSFGLNIRNEEVTCQDIMRSVTTATAIRDSQLLSSPICSTCAFQAHCGNDIVHNYNLSGDFIGYKPFSFVCKRTKFVIEYLLELYENPAYAKVFDSWTPKN